MTFLKGKYSLILIVISISFSKGQDPGSEFVPNLAAFPDGPPPSGDPFEDPLVIANPGEEAVGDALATDPGVEDLIPPASLVSDGAKETAAILDQADVPTEDPSVGGEVLMDPGTAGDGDIVTGGEGAVDAENAGDVGILTSPDVVETIPGETTVVESGTGAIQVEGGEAVADAVDTAVSPMGPTTTTEPVTTVDFNFNLNETFDGRKDLLLLTPTDSTTNDSTVAKSPIPKDSVDNSSMVLNTASDIPGENTAVTDPVDEHPTKIKDVESKTTAVSETDIAPSVIGDSNAIEPTEGNTLHPFADVEIAEIASGMGSQKNISQSMAVVDSTVTPDENMNTSVLIQSPEIGTEPPTLEKQTVHGQTTSSNVVDTEGVTVSQVIPNTADIADTIIETPGIVNTTETTKTTEELLSEYESKKKEFNTFMEKNPDTNFPSPPSPPPSLDTQPERPAESVDRVPKLPPSPMPGSENLEEPLPPSSVPGSENLEEPSVQTPPPTLGPKSVDETVTALPVDKPSTTLPPPPKTETPKDTKPSYQVIDYPIALPPPPPPPSNVFKADFGEDISTKKSTAFVYEPQIPFDPDFDYRPPTDTKQVKPEVATQRPHYRRTAAPKTTDSHKKNAYAYVFEESRGQPRNQPRNQPKHQPDGGISLLQYQHDNRNNVGATRQSDAVPQNAAYRVSDRSQAQNSNSVQALFDKNKKFVASFGEPGIPFYQEFFEQQPKAFFAAEAKPFHEGQDSNRVNSKFPLNSVNARPFSQTNDRMPPINVLEDGHVFRRRNTVPKTRSTATPVAARFQPRSITNPQFSQTQPPNKVSKIDNSFEFWYQLMGKDLQNNKMRNKKTVPSTYENARNMGGKVLNRFWSGANSGRKRGNIETKTPRNVHKNNAHIYQPVKAGSLKPKETMRKNAFVFEPQMQISPVEVSDPHRMKIKEYTITNNPNLISTTEARLNMGVPTLSKPLESEQLSNVMYSLENPPPINIDADISNVAFQTFTTTTIKPNTLPQPTIPSVAAFRIGQRSFETPTVKNRTPDLAFRASSIENPPIPPPIRSLATEYIPSKRDSSPVKPSKQPLATEYIPSRRDSSPVKPSKQPLATEYIPSRSDLSPVNTHAESVNRRQIVRNVPDVEAIPNAMPYVPAEQIWKPRREHSILDLPRPPAISLGSSSGGESVSKAVVENVELPPPIKGARPLHQTTTASYIQEPEPTPVPPMFSINSTIVMKLQNDSVTKDELPPSVCHQCHYVSDVCFLSEAGICNRFVECHRNGDQVRAFEKECAIGNFWNPETLACQKSLYVNCTADPCRNPAVKSHPFLGRCRYFWKCNRGRSEFEFCGQNYRYDGISDTCVPDFECKDEDPPNDVIIPESPPEKCLWTAVDGSLDSFTDGIFNQKCAPGTRFDEVQCTCVISNILPEGEICNPDTLIDFEGEDPAAFKDKSGHMNGIGKENVRLKNGTGFFYGVGKLSFWRYSNVELGPLLAIQIRFFPYGYSKNPMALVSNCNGSPIGATVDIRLNTKTKLATFKLSTNKQLNNFISLPYEPFKWNTAIYVYAGDTFTASINDKKETIPVEGSIPNRHPAIQVGGCNRDDGFRGYADDIKVYNGCIPEEFEYIIFT